REHVEANLLGAMHANGYVADKGIKAAEATLRSGLDAGIKEPHSDLPDDDGAAKTAEPCDDQPRCTLDDVHAVFRRWFGQGYDIDAIDAVMAPAAADRLAGDPLWLLLISAPGNAKTETVSSLAGAGAHVTSTIASEGALLSGSPRKGNKAATGGLLRKIG